MTTENIDIRIREDGARVVSRNIEDIGKSAASSNSLVDLLKRTLGLLGAAFAIDKLKTYADAWSSASGLIAVATKNSAEQIAVQERLFDVAQRTRSGLTDTVELYSRAARAGAELGASQNQVIQFTEGVGKALAVQHVTATAASGALLQLGQLLGTGKVKAQEFNSVLEQVPTILGVVAKNVEGANGSISKLRQIMLDGKLTSKQFFDAFLKGAPQLEADFQKSAITIGQGFTLISNAMTKFIGELNESSKFGQGFGEVAKFIAANLHLIVDAIQVLSIAIAAYFVLLQANKYASIIAAQLQFVQAVASGRAVMLGSAEAAAQKAVAETSGALAAAQAAEASSAAQVAANLTTLRSNALLVESKLAEITATNAGLAIAREDAIAKLALSNANIQTARTTLAAAEAAGALSYALATARAATLELAAAEAVRAAAVRELAVLGTQQARVSALATEALGAQAIATAALSAAQVEGSALGTAASARTAAAATAAAVATEKAAAGTSILSRTLAAFGLGALANPWILLAVAVIAATAAVYKFGDAFDLGTTGAATVTDLFRAMYEVGAEAFTELAAVALEAFSYIADGTTALYESISGDTSGTLTNLLGSYSSFYADVGSGFAGLARAIAKTLDAIGGLLIGLINVAKNTFGGLPSVIGQIFRQVYNVITEYIEGAINVVINGINKVREFVGASLLETVKLDKLDTDSKVFEQYGESIANSIDEGFKTQGGALLNSLDDLLGKADSIAADRLRKAFNKGEKNIPDLNAPIGKPVTATPEATKGIEKMRGALRSLLDTIIPSEGAYLDLMKAAKTLDDAVAHLGLSQEDSDRYFQLALEHYEDIIDPLGKINREIGEQTTLLAFNNREREVESQLLETQKSLKQQGIKLSDDETKALRTKYTELQKLNEIIQAQDSLLTSSVEKRRAFTTQLAAIQNLLADPTSGFTKGDAAQALVGAEPELFSGTKTAIDALTAYYGDMYAKIAAMRSANAIDDATQTQMQTQVVEQFAQKLIEAQVNAANLRLSLGTGGWEDGILASLGRVTQGFTTMSAGMSQAFGDMFTKLSDGFANSVGRAIVYSDNLNDALKSIAKEAIAGLISALVKLGVQWVVQQALATSIGAAGAASALALTSTTAVAAAAAWAAPAALASLATLGANSVPAGAALVSTVALSEGLAAMSLFKQGGYTGNFATDEVAGLVHGKEFVVNAESTAKNRPMLEAINKGMNVSMMTMVNKGVDGYEAGGFVGPVASNAPVFNAPVQTGKSGDRPIVRVIINNLAKNTETRQEERDTPDGRELEVTIENVIVKSVRNGGPVADAFESQYALNRANGTMR